MALCHYGFVVGICDHHVLVILEALGVLYIALDPAALPPRAPAPVLHGALQRKADAAVQRPPGCQENPRKDVRETVGTMT